MVRSVSQESLAEVLSDLARTLLTDFPIQGILDHLVERIVEVLPVTAAGITLISPGQGPRYVAASDAAALRYERLQSELGDGPCVEAYESGAAVTVPDILTETRFPAFTPAARAAGLAAVFTFPLRHESLRIGALDLYRQSSGDLDAWETTTAQTLADVATAYLLNSQARERARETAERFKADALHDALTGLPNRVLLLERMEHAAARGRRSHGDTAVLFADLDRFKQVNDVYGHQVGDQLLVAVGQRLSRLLRPGDTLARVSGDEFVIMCEDMASASDAGALAHRISEAFTAPFDVGGIELTMTASVGVAFAGHGEDMPHQMMRDADAAMYQAKRRGGARHHVFDTREEARAAGRVALVHDLRAAVAGGDLQAHYQPVLRCEDQSVVGLEALVRWTRPGAGPVPAATIVDIAQQHGLIGDLGAWVLERACRDHRRLRTLRSEPLTMSVNVSACQLATPGFVATVEDVLRRTRMDPTSLLLEITESVLIEDIDDASVTLGALKDLGLGLALDDFGTGYSSIGYLRRFPIDVVKVDQGLVAELGVDPTAEAIIRAVTEMAHAVGLGVTAEGVETRAQHDQVVALGCDTAQGYLYARPMPVDQIAADLAGAVLDDQTAAGAVAAGR